MYRQGQIDLYKPVSSAILLVLQGIVPLFCTRSGANTCFSCIAANILPILLPSIASLLAQ